MRWTPDGLASAAGGTLLRRGTAEIAAAFIDSRRPRPGALFVPLVAARDGHDFIGGAIEGGASAVLVGRGRSVPALSASSDGAAQGAPDVTVVEVDDTLAALTRLGAASRDRVAGPVVAITGSNGKTTTRAMVAAVLGTAYDPLLCTQGNLNNHIGVPLTLVDAPHDPAAMVIELGMSAPGENDHLAAIVRPTAAVITSIALEHLEFMGSLEAIAAAEAEVVPHVIEGGVVVVPGDEPLLAPHLPTPGEGRGPRVLRFSAEADADVQVLAVSQSERTEATLRTLGGERVTVRLRCFGAHNARNAAAALAVGEFLGLPLAPMIDALEAVDPVGDRGRVHAMGPHLVIADCYNANPGSMEAALSSLVELRGTRTGPLVAVLGDMLELGPQELALHAEVGQRCAALGIDRVLTLGPRSEAIADAASQAGTEARHYGDDVDAAASAVREALRDAEPGAVLVKASRGMRLERVVEALIT